MFVNLADAMTECTSCTAGRYATAPAQNSCLGCAAGTFSSAVGASAASVCSACLAGTYSTAAAATTISTCRQCDAGTYASGTAQLLCTPCSQGANLLRAIVIDLLSTLPLKADAMSRVEQGHTQLLRKQYLQAHASRAQPANTRRDQLFLLVSRAAQVLCCLD